MVDYDFIKIDDSQRIIKEKSDKNEKFDKNEKNDNTHTDRNLNESTTNKASINFIPAAIVRPKQ